VFVSDPFFVQLFHFQSPHSVPSVCEPKEESEKKHKKMIRVKVGAGEIRKAIKSNQHFCGSLSGMR
jgi:hypothetical protein